MLFRSWEGTELSCQPLNVTRGERSELLELVDAVGVQQTFEFRTDALNILQVVNLGRRFGKQVRWRRSVSLELLFLSSSLLWLCFSLWLSRFSLGLWLSFRLGRYSSRGNSKKQCRIVSSQ